MPTDPEPADDPLWTELVDLVRAHDPVPADLVAMARESFTWRTVDAELAELVADSWAPAAGIGLRGTAQVRLLSFTVGELQLDLEVLAEGGTRRLVGELSPGGPAVVTVEHPVGSVTEEADEFGRFLIDSVPPGRIRIRCLPATGPALVTPWLDA